MVNFEKIVNDMRSMGVDNMPKLVKIGINDSNKILMHGLRYFLGDKAEWLREYDEVASWLSGNEGRGLLCYGNCGRGKTVICGKVIPVIFHHYFRKIVSCYDAQGMNDMFDEVKNKHIIYIDDLGTEGLSVRYGEKRMCFPELADEAEKRGKLLILSTNLTIDELRNKYGERTIDRLKAITKTVLFQGESLRK